MNGQHAPHRKELFLVLFLTFALVVAVMLFTLMITGRYFFAMLSVVAGMFVLGFFQYLLWGWSREDTRGPARGETMHYPR